MEGSTHNNILWQQAVNVAAWLWYRLLPWCGGILTALVESLWQAVSGTVLWLWHKFVLLCRFVWKCVIALWHLLMRTRFGQKLRAFCAALPARIPAPVKRLWANPAVRWGVAAAVAIVCFLPFYVQDVPLDDTIYAIVENEKSVSFFTERPEEEYHSDLLTALPDDSARDMQLILTPGQHITVQHGDELYTVESRKETVANLLRRCKVTCGEDEMVALDISGEDTTITVSKLLYYLRDVPVPTDYRTERVPNPIMDKGTEEVIQEGVPGIVIETYRDTYRKGQLSGSTLLNTTDDTAITEIIQYGTRVRDVDRNDRIKEVVYNEDGVGGYLLFESGDTMTFSRVDTNSTTAYYGGTKTATGHATGIGVIAVDPKVYPYGTRMFIQTASGSKVYGVGTAYDCGGAVKGHIVDVWFPTKADCYSWGRRNCICYILD